MGREKLFETLGNLLQQHSGPGLSFAEVTGVGGVGKTSLVVEYCHQFIGKTYGLVIFLRAASSASIAADLRRLATDLGFLQGGSSSGSGLEKGDAIEGNDVDDDDDAGEVIGLIKSKLARCTYRWLIVFDNVEDPAMVMSYLPSGVVVLDDHSSDGGGGGGHVIFTTREHNPTFSTSCGTLHVGPFDATDSCRYLEKAVALTSDDADVGPSPNERQSFNELASKLDHLPLALSLAAAYLTKTDISIGDYIKKLADGPAGLESALDLSVERIAKESAAAVAVVRLLGYLSPDGVTRRLVLHLTKQCVSHQGGAVTSFAHLVRPLLVPACALLGVAVTAGRLFRMTPPRTSTSSRFLLAVDVSIVALAGVGATSLGSLMAFQHPQGTGAISQPVADLQEEVSHTWQLLQTYNILTVRGPRTQRVGSIHRLQQAALRSRSRSQSNPTHVAKQLELVVSALVAMWTFDPSNATTWDDPENAFILSHVQAVLEHASCLAPSSRGSTALAGLLKATAVFAIHFLSRFDLATTLLKAACVLRPDDADILHLLGKTLRILGAFEQAEGALNRALSTRRLTRSPLVSDTLHELGVLKMRQQHPAAATAFLTDALAQKGALLPEKRALLETGESATLYQLSCIHSAAGRLDMALDLLLQVVAQEGAAGTGSPVSHAASLQQLGRIHLRKGNLEVAEGHFLDAIALYYSVYGREKAATHLNVAAVRHQLGACYAAQKQYDSAAEQFGLALVARETAAATLHSTQHGGSLHLEVMHELQALGQVEADRGNYADAEAHFARQHAMCCTCLAELSPELVTWLEQHEADGATRKAARAAVIDGAKKKRFDGVVRSWLFALNGLRMVAKKKGDSARAAEIKAQAKDVGRRYDLLLGADGKNSDDGDCDDACKKKHDIELVHRLSLFRDAVRAAAKRCAQGRGWETDDKAEAGTLAQEAHYILQFIAGIGGDEAAASATVAVANDFVRAVMEESKYMRADKLFHHCDHVRSRLRSIGHTIVDI